jgi:hypothetical protein
VRSRLRAKDEADLGRFARSIIIASLRCRGHPRPPESERKVWAGVDFVLVAAMRISRRRVDPGK